MKKTIPNPVIAVVAEVLGQHYYSHSKLNTLFMEAGAPGEPPVGNCVEKCMSWLKRVNESPEIQPLTVLGGVLLQLMETGGGSSIYAPEVIAQRQERIRAVLARCGLAYHESGVVLAGGTAPPVASLQEALRRRDLPALELEFKRALDSIEADPPAAATAACSILESLFKILLNEHGVSLPQKETIVEDVAETELRARRYKNQDSALKTIHDACARRLKPDVGNIRDFDTLADQWLRQNSMRLKDILLRHSVNRSQRAVVTDFFKDNT